MRDSFHEAVKTVANVVPQSIATTSVDGTVVDVSDFRATTGVLLTPATIAGTSVTIKLQEGTLANGSDMADIAGCTKTAVAGADGNAYRVVDNRQIRKKYARSVVTSVGTNILAACLELSLPIEKPVTPQTTDVVVNV